MDHWKRSGTAQDFFPDSSRSDFGLHVPRGRLLPVLVGRFISFKDVQSGAYAPPKRLPTRSPPITRDLTLPLAAAHTLTRVAEAKPRRRGPPASTQPRRQRRPPMWSAPTLSSSAHTFLSGLLHGGGQGAPNTLGGTPEQVLEAAASEAAHLHGRLTRGSVIGSALTLLPGVPGKAPSSCIVGPSPRHQKTGRVSRFNFFTSRSPAPFKSAATAVWHVGLRSCRPARVSGGSAW